MDPEGCLRIMPINDVYDTSGQFVTRQLVAVEPFSQLNAAGSRAVFHGGNSSGDQVSTGAVAVGPAITVGRSSGTTVWLGLEAVSLGLAGGTPPFAATDRTGGDCGGAGSTVPVDDGERLAARPPVAFATGSFFSVATLAVPINYITFGGLGSYKVQPM
uniref:Uncharacterized protein n=1 Tax=Anopheles melas TaxID=34690 RepID=A0A182TQH9_9DIPT